MLLMLCFILGMIPTVLTFMGRMDKMIMILMVVVLFAIYLMFLIKSVFIDNAHVSARFIRKFDLNKPTDNDLQEGKVYKQ